MSQRVRRQIVAWSMVAAQVVLVVALLLAPGAWSPVPRVLWGIGLVLSAVGLIVAAAAGLRLGRQLTPSPLPRDSGELEVTGLYRWVRHPIYAGLLLFAAGRIIGDGGPIRLAAFALLLVLLVTKARWEEARLSERFPAYTQYAASTPRFLPIRPRNL